LRGPTCYKARLFVNARVTVKTRLSTESAIAAVLYQNAKDKRQKTTLWWFFILSLFQTRFIKRQWHLYKVE
jgi:hypothetical protein